MKKIVFVAICVLGIICFSSCRSTSQSCGLADADTTIQTTLKQSDLL
ncbi:hypothetical protein [Polaribacter cellanae]|uniref:Uncharacterized protein n=1 Tax=Polaribacter cellanae TaxID=2818493 RepID=A0A975H7E8_9FLAO|nr:hypothetical protein [Polaribacter cellanae]QTE23446.1 hypothetical protein J3359_03970 [Polaribacter cellanae]